MGAKDFSAAAKAALQDIPLRDFPFAEPAIPQRNKTPRQEDGRLGERAGTVRLPNARLVDIYRIKADPNQPRKTFLQTDLDELAQSLRTYGMLQPISVEYIEKGDFFQIIAGERRFRAAKLAGFQEIPCMVRENLEDSTRLIQQLVENLQREDIPPLEEAEGIATLIEKHNLTHREVAEKLGKSRPAVTNSQRLMKLPKVIRDECRNYPNIGADVLLQIVSLETEYAMAELWGRIKRETPTVREVRSMAKNLKDNQHEEAYTYKYAPPNKAFKLQITFPQGEVETIQIVEALQVALSDLRRKV